jgi:hypothetical protein
MTDREQAKRQRHDRLPTLAEVTRAIPADVATLVESAQAGSAAGNGAGTTPAHDAVSGVTIYDPAAPPASFPGAIVLAVGLPVFGPDMPDRIRALRAAGYCAVVYKAHGAADEELRLAARAAGISLLRASDDVPWEQLSAIIETAVMPHGPGHPSLVGIRPGDLFELANTVASLAGGAIAIADVNQTLLAYSTLPEHPIDETRRNSILQLHVPHTTQNDVDYRRVHAATGVVTVAPSGDSFTRWAVAIRAGSAVLGSLWLIDSDEGPSTDAAPILLEAANVAAVHLLHRRSHYNADRERQLGLVMPLLFEPGRAELAAVQLGIAATSVRIAALTTRRPAGTASETLQASLRLFDAVRSACAVWLPTAVCGLADNVVYVVLPQTGTANEAADVPRFQRQAVLRIAHHTRRLLSLPVFGGLGDVAPVAAADRARADAEAVLAALLSDAEDGLVQADSDGIVADRQSLGPRLQLRQMTDTLLAAGQLPGDLASAIAEHDARRNTAFELTLLTWLDCGANAIETANRLGLHPNTVRYRLSRMEPQFGVRLDDPETRLLLWLQLWARQH